MELEFNKTDTDRKEKYLQNGLKWLCYLAGNSKRTCFFTFFQNNLLQLGMKFIDRGPILHVTSSETRSICVKQALNTRR